MTFNRIQFLLGMSLADASSGAMLRQGEEKSGARPLAKGARVLLHRAECRPRALR